MPTGKNRYHIDIDDLNDPYSKAIGLQRRHLMNPRGADDLTFYAALLMVNGQFEESEHVLNQCLERYPDDAYALHQKSILLLHNGDYSKGLPMYENRFVHYPESFVGPKLRTWDGKPTDKPVVLWQEGGYGDVILPARYIPEVVKRCPNTFLFTHNKLKSLLASSRLTRGVSTTPDLKQQADLNASEAYQCSLMSLPCKLGVTLDTVNGAPYLRARRAEIKRWRHKLVGKSLIGFAWCGNPTWERDITRSMPLDRARELASIIEVMPLLPELTGAQDWSDTAAIISNLDLVISTCTAIAHCAAALGKPTWLLLSYDSDWRWGRNWVTYPRWYNSIRAFRCPKHGDWQTVIKAVYQSLKWGFDGLEAKSPEAERLS